MEQKVRAILIVEIAGRPPEHIREALKGHVGKMKSIKGVEYISEDVSEAKLIDEEKDVYSCFAEVEVEVENFAKLTELVFDFFPSSVEVIEPESLRFNAQEATMFLNDLAGRLHKYDEIAKIAQLQTKQLAQRLQMFQTALAEQKVKVEEKTEKPKKEKKVVKKKSKK
jgi:hypothetical protein